MRSCVSGVSLVTWLSVLPAPAVHDHSEPPCRRCSPDPLSLPECQGEWHLLPELRDPLHTEHCCGMLLVLQSVCHEVQTECSHSANRYSCTTGPFLQFACNRAGTIAGDRAGKAANAGAVSSLEGLPQSAPVWYTRKHWMAAVIRTASPVRLGDGSSPPMPLVFCQS